MSLRKDFMGDNVSLFADLDKRNEEKKLLDIFTDRREAVELFEKRHYLPLKEALKNTGDIADGFSPHVINFYGEAGIGKTSLLEKIRSVQKAESKTSPLFYIKHDFRGYTTENKASVMVSLALRMQKELDFIFPLTQAASKKIHKEKGSIYIPDRTLTDRLKKTKGGSLFMVLSTNLSPFKTVIKTSTQLLDCFENVFGIDIVGRIKKLFRTPELNRYIDNLNTRNAESLENEFELYFGYDLLLNMALSSRPLTLVFDTYEHYTKESADKDSWLKNPDTGLIWKVPGIIWIISGRENVSDNGNSWINAGVDSLELLPFSDEDAISLLNKLDVADDRLIDFFISTAHGSPFFLSRFYSTYHSLSSHPERQSDIESYGRSLEETVGRYLENLSDAEKEIAKTLSVISAGWDDDMISAISAKLSSFSLITYFEMMKRSSMFIRKDDGYEMQENCRNVISASLPSGFCSYVEKIVLEYRREKALTSDTTHDIYSYSLSMLDSSNSSYESFHQSVEDKILEHVFNYRLEEASSILSLFEKSPAVVYKADIDLYVSTVSLRKYIDYQKSKRVDSSSALSTFDESGRAGEDARSVYLYVLAFEKELLNDGNGFLEAASESYEMVARRNRHSKRTFLAAYQLACAYRINGDNEKAREFDLESFNSALVTFGEDHTITLTLMLNLARDYNDAKDSEMAIRYASRCYEKRKAILGRENPATLEALYMLAIFHSALGNHDKARELQEECYISALAILGEDHPDTRLSLMNLINNYRNTERVEGDMSLNKREYDLRVRLYGENDHDTISLLAMYAVDLYHAGKIEQARDLFSKCYEKFSTFTNDLNNIYVAGVWLLRSLFYLNQYEEAYELGKKLIEPLRGFFGDNDDNLVSAVYFTSGSAIETGKPDRVDLCRNYVDLVKASSGMNSSNVISPLILLIRACYGLHEFDLMKEYLDEVLNLCKINDIPLDDVNCLEANLWLGHWYYSFCKDEDSAYAVFEGIYPRFIEKEGLSVNLALEALYNFAGCAGSRGESKRCIKLLEEDYALCNKYLDENANLTLSVALRLVEYYYENNQERALSISKRIYQITKEGGSDDIRYLDAANKYAACLIGSDQNETAREILYDIIRPSENFLGTEHPLTLLIKINISAVLFNLGEYEKSLALSQTIYPIYCKVEGRYKKNVLSVLFNEASALDRLGRSGEAVERYSQFCMDSESSSEADENLIIRALDRLISLFESRKEYSLMHDAAVKYLSHCEREYGRDSWNVAFALFRIGCSHDFMNQYDKAITYHLECQECLKRHPQDHDLILKNTHNLANAYAECGEYEKAITLLSENYPLVKSSFGSDSQIALYEMGMMIDCSTGCKEDETAMLVADHFLSELHEERFPHDRYIMRILDSVYMLYKRNGKKEEALSALKRRYDMLLGSYTLSDSDVQRTCKNLVEQYMECENYVDALNMADDFYDFLSRNGTICGDDILWTYEKKFLCFEEMEDYENALSYELLFYDTVHDQEKMMQSELFVLCHIINAFDHLGDTVSKISYQHQIYRLSCKKRGKEDRKSLKYLHDIAQSWLLLDNLSKAIELESECAEAFVRVFGAEDKDTRMVVKSLSAMYHQKGDYKKALEITQQFSLMSQKGY